MRRRLGNERSTCAYPASWHRHFRPAAERPAGRVRRRGRRDHYSLLPVVLNEVPILLPRNVTAPMTAMAIRATISAYSTAVAPRSRVAHMACIRAIILLAV